MFIHMEKVQKLFCGHVATHESVHVRIERVDPALARQHQVLGYFIFHILGSFPLTHGYVMEHWKIMEGLKRC